MLLFRLALLLLLLAAGVSFVLYIGTGQMRFRAYGIRLLTWAVVAGLAFFGMLALERLL